MRIYTFLSRVPVLKQRFPLKILAVAFVGIHIPLFSIIGYLLITALPVETAKSIALLTLAFTLLATGITLFLLNKLLKPVMLAKSALNDYIQFHRVPALPIEFDDEAGILMGDVQKAIEDLERAEDERQNVLHILSHDLQSPIRTALGLTGLLKDDVQKYQEELLPLLEDSLTSQLDQLRYFLDMLKEQKLDLDLDTEKPLTQVPALIEESVNEFKTDLGNKNLEIATSGFDGALNLPVNSLQRVLNNVINNAIKYSYAGSKIEIEACKNDRTLNLRVKDNGRGFDPEDAERVFMYNSPLQKKGTNGEHSSGVGMFLCKNIMKRIGGDIKAESEGEDKGATFTISYLFDN